ncbi:nuclear transport factor 2 family protein [Photobacterium sp. BZF1]|uniref:nuclear transport factor 2 family protein n=1 Tax=Photobacterium sp. BZF1 TaxID=1904457 RepID=UPI0016537744|nr:nuclear transport factor 2 family protein [Photobacterium sp. BZF1]MBC7003030.1 nuclear transport factor 2 family protein [Photobacterium sp. BZF1]
MIQLTNQAALFVAMASSSSFAIADCQVLGEIQRSNIETAVNSSKSNFNLKDPDSVFNFISEHRYIQHVPNGRDGGEALVGVIKFFKEKMPTFKVENVRSLAENDIVLTQSIDYLEGKPIEVSYDWYRVNNGKITEHWDVVSEFKTEVDPSIYTSGPGVDFKSCLDKEKLRAIALDYFYTTWDRLDTRAIKAHVSDDFVQHNPDAILKGVSDKQNLIDIVTAISKAGGDIHIEISKVIVTGDFVAIHAKWTEGDSVTTVTDLLRFDENYKIVEHWDGLKAVPAENSNPRDPVF